MHGLSINPIRRVANTVVNGIVNIIPPATFRSNGKFTNSVKWVGQHFSSPQNRLILGVTALMSQPFIDLNNRRVDDETKKISAARTVAKIIAGTSTGVLVRYLCIVAAHKFTLKPSPKINKIYSLFYPKATKVVRTKGLKKYIDTMGTILSLVVMLFTNFLIDAPLTKFLTNKFIGNIDTKPSKNPAKPRPNMSDFLAKIHRREVNNE